MVTLNLPQPIVTERLFVQRLRYEDAEEIFYAYGSKPEATRFLTWPTHQSISDTQSFLHYAEDAWKNGTEYAFGVRLRDDSRLIGGFGVMNDDGKLQIGYVYSPAHWGNGYATEVCKKMISTLRQQEGVYRIQSFVDVENVASISVLLQSGMIEEARLSKWFRFVNQDNQAKDCIHFRVPFVT
jgi:ribosomal-protein-alanine N-acetyltransferase